MPSNPYHLHLQTLKRGKGKSAVAKHAYNSGTRARDLRTGKTWDYRSKKKGVLASEYYLPAGVAADLHGPAFWNEVEAREIRWDSWVARELNGALPAGLSKEGRKAILDAFCRFLADDLETVIWGNIHAPGRGNKMNHHCHIQFPTREFDGCSLGTKHRFLDSKKTSGEWLKKCRAEFAKIINRELEKEGRAERFDHRTLEEQGVDREPTRHRGPKTTWHLKKKAAELAKLEAELAAEEILPLTEAEMEAASRLLSRLIAGETVPEAPFHFGSDDRLAFDAQFKARIAKTEERSQKATNSALDEFLDHLAIAEAAYAEARLAKEEEKRRRQRREGGLEEGEL